MSTPSSNTPQVIQRFTTFRVLEHGLTAVVFTTLVVTGLAQKFATVGLAEWVMRLFGGIDTTRLVHRTAGLVFALSLVLHVLTGLYLVVSRRSPATMVINFKDFSDAIANMRFYLGIADHPAQCDRFDYKQKFEYWGCVFGGFVMIATGFILWFPTDIFHLLPFLPAEIIPAAKVAHTSEAMLAFLIIITWHIYGCILSPEVFPLDTSIFTGNISVERMRHEHPLELERLTGEPVPAHHASPPATPHGPGGRTPA
ncbi:MAG: cytochrome b/b6 domain-containing protein [Candidatus Riflebacteria bacterium]|nr:cytochrome b/b6 domain-containing protein [Candidatus Riflebacteria bacterium]